MASIGTDPGILDDINNGRIPVISWNCADNIPASPATPIPLTGIAAGNADPDIATIRAQLQMLKYPGTNNYYPVIIRYFWEFNINATQSPSPVATGANNNGGCFTGPLQPPNYTNYAAEFINAWNHIHEKLQPTAGVPNITFDWNPNVSDTDVGYNNGLALAADPSGFYPGSGSVDWIGADGYSKLSNNFPSLPKTFSDVFGVWYNEFSSYGKPMMIGETGSCRYYGDNNLFPDQSGYIQQLENVLGPSGSYPNIAALNYFDAPGGYNPVVGQNCNYDLDPNPQATDSISGIAAFTALANDSKFLNRVTP
jgi:hypothetical protein